MDYVAESATVQLALRLALDERVRKYQQGQAGVWLLYLLGVLDASTPPSSLSHMGHLALQ